MARDPPGWDGGPPDPRASLGESPALIVNGEEHRLDVDARTTLLDAPRERLHLTGTRKGCGLGQCGACTVLVGSRRVASCPTLAVTSMALLEQTDRDERSGRPTNASPAEYLVPVNAAMRERDVTFVPGDDTIFNPLGVKGVAEHGLSVVAAAIGDAVYRATGRRVREFPILPERLVET